MSQTNLLLLSKWEQKILDSLSENGVRPQDLMREQKIPHASAYLAFSKLQQRGLAYPKKKDHKLLWCRTHVSEVRSNFGRSEVLITREKGARITPHDGSDIVVHVGREQIRRLIRRILDLPEGSKVTIFQGTYTDGGFPDSFSVKEIILINRALSEGKIVFESIIPDDYFEKIIPVLGEMWARSYADRPNKVYSFPSRFYFSRAEFHIYKDLVFIIDMKDKIAIEIKNKEILALLQGVISFIKENSQIMDVREEIKKFKQR